MKLSLPSPGKILNNSKIEKIKKAYKLFDIYTRACGYPAEFYYKNILMKNWILK